jgi:hypothetical protein
MIVNALKTLPGVDLAEGLGVADCPLWRRAVACFCLALALPFLERVNIKTLIVSPGGDARLCPS